MEKKNAFKKKLSLDKMVVARLNDETKHIQGGATTATEYKCKMKSDFCACGSGYQESCDPGCFPWSNGTDTNGPSCAFSYSCPLF